MDDKDQGSGDNRFGDEIFDIYDQKLQKNSKAKTLFR